MAVEFRVLGNVEALIGDRAIDVGHVRQRCVLAVLLVEANRPVSVDQLVDRVWGDRPAQRARGALYTYLSRLRRALAVAEDVDIRRAGGGYRLSVDPDAVDLHRFHRLVSRLRRAEPDAGALAMLDEALGWWRGEPFADMRTEWFDSLRADLLNRRWAVELERNDLALASGRHAELLAGLTATAAAHPFDERLAGQVMLALYRCGRQADALAHYERVRRSLADELGADPGSALRRLHRQVLTGDEAIGEPPPPTYVFPRDSPDRPTPRQLPAPPRSFVGRTDELSRLEDVVADGDPTAPVVVISGTAGVGKTALAVHWAHHVADRFRHGQLFVNLRGFDASGARIEAGQALRDMLRALHVRPEQIPAEVPAQSALYRSLLADRQVLVVLDNADTADQVRPLLPGSSGCLTLVTSRSRMPGLVALDDAKPIAVELFTDVEARTMLSRRLGANRVDAEPNATDDLVRLSARLPLALAIVAARAAAYPRLLLAALAADLHRVRYRLDALTAGDPATDVRAVFSWSYEKLTPAAARGFRLLGLASGHDLSIESATSLFGVTARATEQIMDELTRTHLADETAPGRFSCHDLLRAYALELVTRHDTEADRREARRRLWDHYLGTAHGAAMLLDPHRAAIAVSPPADGAVIETFPDQPAAMTWFAAEFPVLLDTIREAERAGADQHTWQLSWSLSTFCNRRGHWHEWAAVSAAALRAAERLGDAHAQALAHHSLARAWTQLDRAHDADPQYERAIALFAARADTAGEASVHASFGWALERRERYADALTHAVRALELSRAGGNTAAEARALNAVGWYQSLLGRHRDALAACTRALALLEELDNRAGQAATYDSLGYTHHQLGDHDSAIGCFERALELLRAMGDRYNESQVLTHLGDVHQAAGDAGAAERSWERALTILVDLKHGDTEQVRARLGS